MKKLLCLPLYFSLLMLFSSMALANVQYSCTFEGTDGEIQRYILGYDRDDSTIDYKHGFASSFSATGFRLFEEGRLELPLAVIVMAQVDIFVESNMSNNHWAISIKKESDGLLLSAHKVGMHFTEKADEFYYNSYEFSFHGTCTDVSM
jgi:hypothetical protein